jgi:signal transduction histidine kinase
VPLAVLALGLVSVALLIGSDSLRQRTVLDAAERLQATGEIEAGGAISHLWLEEYVSGDRVQPGEIETGIERALELVEAMLGEPSAADPRLEIPPAEGVLRRRAAELRASIEEFRALAAERQLGYDRGLSVGVGSDLDVEYDRIFVEFLAAASSLKAALEDHLQRRQQSSRLVFLAIVAAWSLIVVFAAAGLWSYERQRRQAEEAFSRSREELMESQRLEAMGRLAGGLAHDINNYLAAIRAQCEVVRMKRPAGDRIARKMDSAIRTVHKASSLLDRLLAFSRQQPVELEVVDLNRVVEGLEKMVRPSLGEDVRITTRLASDLWNVEVDLAQIEQVLVNLLVNARDAMPEGGTIRIETTNLMRPGGARDRSGTRPDAAVAREEECVRVAVTDTGRGIPPEVRDKIFEPFWTTKERGVGGGLGLATVYGIVRQSGGSIEVESEVGRGTTFEIFLPRCEKPASASVPPLSSVVTLGGSERILLVDDNQEYRQSTGALLEALGYRVTAAADGEEALATFNAAPGGFDLVLSDVGMPRMGGRELARRLRESGVPVILMSGHSEEAMDRLGIGPDEVHFSKRHFSATSLARQIRDALDLR